MTYFKEIALKAPLSVVNSMYALPLPADVRWFRVNVEGYPGDEYLVTVYFEHAHNVLLRVVIDGPKKPPPPPPWWRRLAGRVHFRLLMWGWFRRLTWWWRDRSKK